MAPRTLRFGPSGPPDDLESLEGQGLLTTFFVAPSTSLPTDDQIGSAEFPFKTITQAAAAVVHAGGGTIKLTADAYPAESISVTGAPLTVSGLPLPGGDGIDLSLVSFTSDSELAFENLADCGAITTPGNLRVASVLVSGAIDVNDLFASESSLRGTVTVAGDATLVLTDADGELDVQGDLFGTGTPGVNVLPSVTTVGGAATLFGYITTGLDVGTLDARFCDVRGTTVFTEADFRECLLTGTFLDGSESIPVTMDLASFSEFVTNAVTVVGTILLSRNDLPAAHANLNVDGSSPISFTLLPAPHPSGVYNWSLYFVKKTAATGGNLVAQLNYVDTSGAAVLLRPNASLVATGHFNLAPFPIYSDGTTDITVDYTFPGLTGSPVMDLFSTLVQQG